ncbi:piggyBac transposable element-derived protein 4 [Colossoma macropomum]|uniref:piggyBac transposable element-derived protein 4 n=1 Tax=Colossoma macropomum TaxID=42526 RepID=UPI00186498AC|nr:piggyBac transposable element-derived protein 4 [Colossoma macropomum]
MEAKRKRCFGEEDGEEEEEESDTEAVRETDSESSVCSYDSEEEEAFLEGEDLLLDRDYNDEDSNEEWEPSKSSEGKRAKPASSPSAKKRKTIPVTLTPPSTSSGSLSEGPCSTPMSSSDKCKGSASKRTPKRRSNSTKKCPLQAASDDDDDEKDMWHDISEEDKQPDLPSFQPQRPPGPQLLSCTSYTPLELFKLFMSMSVVGKIVENTNAHAEKRAQAGKRYTWYPLTVEEFYTYIGLVIYMGLMPLKRFSDYWSEKSIYNLPFPRSVMSRNRFLAITWNLHLCNLEKDEENMCKKGTPEYDRLFKIKPLYTDLLSACQTYFQPSRELSIDERMVASKARIGLKQYMKDKPTKWGCKLFVLADLATGYTWNFFVYEGKSKLKTQNGLGYDSVTQLVNHPLLGKGYKLYMGNFYTSPKLLSDLYAAKTLACGTIPMKRQGFPRTRCHDMPRKAVRGTIRWIRRGELLFVKWMDNREVALCTTMHKAYDGDNVSRRVKDTKGVWQVSQVPIPCAVQDYNKNMGGVDFSDALVGCYNVLHKTKKWYKTVFYHFIDIAVVNSFIMHKELTKANSRETVMHKQFRETLATDLTKMLTRLAPPQPPLAGDECYPDFFSEDSRVGRRACELCKQDGKKVKTSAFCMKCRVALCLMPKRNCFLQWHQEGLHYIG